jgi:Asparaginase
LFALIFRRWSTYSRILVVKKGKKSVTWAIRTLAGKAQPLFATEVAGDPVNHSGKVTIIFVVQSGSMSTEMYQRHSNGMSIHSWNEKSTLLPSQVDRNKQNYVLVIHGGAGTMSRQDSTPEKLTQFRDSLRQALYAGYDVLYAGGEAMDAAAAAVAVMEGSTMSLCSVSEYRRREICTHRRLSSVQCRQGRCFQHWREGVCIRPCWANVSKYN